MAKIKNGQVDLSTLELLLSYKYLDNSYKLFWFKSIFKLALSGKKKISFHELALYMIVEAWDLVAVKEISFGRLDKLHRSIVEIIDFYHTDPSITEADLLIILKDINDKDILDLIKDLYEETPYSFIEPLFTSQLKGQNHTKKLASIAELSKSDSSSLYQIDSANHCIILNDKWISFFKKQQKSIDGFLHDTLAYFLDKNASKRK